MYLTVPRCQLIGSAGWLTSQWWSSGGYEFRYKGRTFWRLCLEHRERQNIGYNACITQVGDAFKGLIWKDSSTMGVNDETLALKVTRALKIKI